MEAQLSLAAITFAMLIVFAVDIRQKRKKNSSRN